MNTLPVHIADQVKVALHQNPHFRAKGLRFETHQGRVTLHGVVGSYYHKQMAQEVVRRVDGVDQVENRLEVNWS